MTLEDLVPPLEMYELLEAMEREGNSEFPLNRIGDVLKKARGE